jgi:hypothetical protein
MVMEIRVHWLVYFFWVIFFLENLSFVSRKKPLFNLLEVTRCLIILCLFFCFITFIFHKNPAGPNFSVEKKQTEKEKSLLSSYKGKIELLEVKPSSKESGYLAIRMKN